MDNSQLLSEIRDDIKSLREQFQAVAIAVARLEAQDHQDKIKELEGKVETILKEMSVLKTKAAVFGAGSAILVGFLVNMLKDGFS